MGMIVSLPGQNTGYGALTVDLKPAITFKAAPIRGLPRASLKLPKPT